MRLDLGVVRRFRVHLIALLTLAACTSATTSTDAPAPPASAEPASDPAIVFVRSPDFESPGAVFSIAADGSDEREISEVWAEGAIVAPDGDRFAEPVQGDDGRITTAVFDGDGANRTVLSVPDPTLQLGVGAWSPDGASLLLEGWDDTDDTRDGLYLRAPSEDSYLRRMTDPGDGHDFPGPFSPDGSRILVYRTSEGDDDDAQMDLYLVRPYAGDPIRLNPAGTSTGLTLTTGTGWSPDGRRVAFVASDGRFSQDRRAVFVAAADGSDAERITPWSGTSTVSWSPDGRWLAFDISDGGAGDLAVVHPDGSGLVAVTSSDDGRYSMGPVWSPDGASILFIRSEGAPDEADLWVTTVDAPEPVQLTDSPALYEGYAWLP